MKAKYLILLLSLGLFTTSSFAQETAKIVANPINQFIAVSWEINVPSGNDLISETSLAGGKIEYRKFFSDKFSAGIGFSWNTTEQYFPTKTYEKPDGSIAVTT